ncbi:MAG: hypothetical protein IJU93_06385 [Lachnospiraceae bacterium]|nr:hypothetical protein [Lachnospiraceae bacterium]
MSDEIGFFALAFIIFIIMHVFNLWGDDDGSSNNNSQPGYGQTEQAGEADDEFEFDNESI